MIGFALLGAGRIGKMHGGFIASHAQANLLYVYDINRNAAAAVAKEQGAQVAEHVEHVFEDPEVEAVLIASSTDTHVDLIIRAIKSGKAVFCEKPISLDMDVVTACLEEIKDSKKPIQIGFNRRFNPSHKALRDAIKNGEIGNLEQLVITSRDPGLPAPEYLKVCGGIFRDMLIHDFDMARFIMDEDPVEMQVIGSTLIDPNIVAPGDADSVMVIMKSASGMQCHINASRRAVYGYDQRIEALGSLGMLQSNNPLPTTIRRYDANATEAGKPLYSFFIDRYELAYRAQMNAFVEAVVEGRSVSPSFEDGRKAQLLAEAAQRAFTTGDRITLNQ